MPWIICFLGLVASVYSTIFVPSAPSKPVAPPAKENDPAAVGLRYMAGIMRGQQGIPTPQKMTRDLGSHEAGGLYNGIQSILQLLVALQALSAAPAPATPPADAPAGPAPAGPAPASPAPAPPAGLDPLALIQLLQLTGGFGRGGAVSDDANDLALGYGGASAGCEEVKPGSICDLDTEIRKILPLPQYVLAIGDRKAFQIGYDGTPEDPIGQPLADMYQNLNGTPTCSLRFGEMFIVFYGDNLMLFDNATKPIAGMTPVNKVFFGMKNPLRGAFMFNDHTLTLFSDRQFVFYQPLANPPIDPRFSPQPNDIIPGGPEQIDGAFQLADKKYIYRDEWLYEMSDHEMRVTKKMPLRKRLNSGWINCKKHCK